MTQETIDVLIEEFLDHLKVERNVSPLTIRNYRHYLTRFSSWLNKKVARPRPASLDLKLLKQYRVYLADFADDKGNTLSRSTQNYHVVALRSFLRWLVKNDYETVAPEKVDLPKGESRSLKFLRPEHIERLLSQPSISEEAGLRDKAILEAFFSTGLRVSELVKLNRDQIDLARREFGVVGKGGRSRVVFLSERAARWLGRYLGARNDDFRPLFIRYSGKNEPERDGENMRLTSRSVQRLVEKYVKQAKLPVKATPHVLRHSFATDLLVAGADIRSVQEMLGHKNIATTQIYTHVTDQQLRQVHEAFHGKGR